MLDLCDVLELTAQELETDYFAALASALAKLEGVSLVLVLGATASEPFTILACASPAGPLPSGASVDVTATPLSSLIDGASIATTAPRSIGPFAIPSDADWLVGARTKNRSSAATVIVFIAAARAAAEDIPLRSLQALASRGAAELGAIERGCERRDLACVRLRYGAALLDLAPVRMPTFEAQLRVILERAARTIQVERASYWSIVEQGEAISCEQAFVSSENAFARGGRLAAQQYPAYFASLRDSHAIDASDALDDPRTAEFRDGYLRVHGIRAMLDIPVWQEGRLAGVLCLEHTGASRRWTAEDIGFASGIAQSITIGLECAARGRSTAQPLVTTPFERADVIRAVAQIHRRRPSVRPLPFRLEA